MTTADRLAAVRDRIKAACTAVGRGVDEVTLIAVSKTKPPEAVNEAIAADAADFGENRVQEAAAKRPKTTGDATWHLIGPLQRNKARIALETFDVLHTLDRPALASRLQFLLAEGWPGRILPVLIEVNLGREEQKAGVLPEEASAFAEQVATTCPSLRLEGLMAIPPFADDPEATRPHFRDLRVLRDSLCGELGLHLPHLSMGMSHDFEVAISEGATMVRVGTAIFGPRSK